MSRTKGTYTLTSNIEPKVGAPLDARTVVKLKSDLTAPGTFAYPYVGLTVFVEEDQKKYTLIDIHTTYPANWREEGTGTTTSADHVTYDSTTSHLDATNAQDAIDEIVSDLGTAAYKDVATSGDASSTQVVLGNDTRLSDARTPLSHSHTTNDISDFPDMTTYIEKSQTSGFVKNDGTIDTNTYVQTESGKGLSSNDYTDADKAAVSGLGTASTHNVPAFGNASTTEVVLGNDTRLTDARPASDVSAWAKASTKPTYNYSEIQNTPTLGTAAGKDYTNQVTEDSEDLITSGAVYDALENLPSDDTWRSIQVNGTEVQNGTTSSGPLKLVNGTNTSVAFDSTNKTIQVNATDTNTTYSLTQDSSDGHKITLTPSSGTAQTITIPDNDTKVTSSANHYTPATASGQDKSANASGATAAWSIDVVKGVTLNTDGKGHVTGLSVTSGKIPGNPNTDEKVKQTPSTTNSNFEVLFSGTADNTEHIEGTKKTTTLRFNPSLGALMEGDSTVASGDYSHAEGGMTTASGIYSHAAGYHTCASGAGAHAEGGYTTADDVTPGNTASGDNSHAEGLSTTASGENSHAEGFRTSASGFASHAEGGYYVEGRVIPGGCASGAGSHAEGLQTIASGVLSHTEGENTTASGFASHTEGSSTKASGTNSHTEGGFVLASGTDSHAEGDHTTASGYASHTEGCGSIAEGDQSHAEGEYTTASGLDAHAEGMVTSASGDASHAEGYFTKASGYGAHAEGGFGRDIFDETGNTASGNSSHAEGYATIASGFTSHAEGNSSTASGEASHASGTGTCAAGNNQTVVGKYNVADTTSLFIVGNGTANNARSNALSVNSDNTTTLGASGTITSGNTKAVTGGAVYTALSNKLDASLKGAANGVAELDSTGKVPSSQLPSYVDDVLEYDSQSAFPATGEAGKIYVAKDTNKTYRWSGTAYVEISPSLALGETSSTAYRGDRGKTAYNHATDSSRLTTATSVGLYKVGSTAQGHISGLTAVEKADITGLGIPAQDTTYSAGTGITLSGTTIKAKLKSETASTLDSATISTTASRQYAVHPDKSGYLSVNVPWKNDNTTYSAGTGMVLSSTTFKTKLKNGDTASSLAAAATTTTASRQYAVEPDSSGYLSVNVPWQNTTYSSKAAASGGTEVSLVTTGEKYTWNNKTSNTGTVTSVATGAGLTGGTITTSGTIKCALAQETNSTLASAAITTTASRQYAVHPDSNGKLSVNVPWSNTTYSAGTGLSLSGTTVNHSNSVTAGTAKGDDSKTLTFGGTFTIPSVTYDAQGHVTAKGTTTMTMPANPNTDTKNTAGSTDTSSKIFLVGATSQAANPQTYSDDQVYTTSGTLTSNKVDTKAIIALAGSGTAGQDKGSGVSPRYIPALWTFNSGITVANGEVYFIKIPVAGGTWGVWLSLNNGTNYYPVAVATGTSRFTTHYPANTVIAITYESGSKCSCYAKTGGDALAEVTGTFRVLNDYDANTTYSAMSSSELTTGTATSSRVVRADYLKTGINSLIDTKIGALDVTGGTNTAGKTVNAWSETDGKISLSFQNISITKSQVSDFAHSHDLSLATDSGTSSISLAANTKYKLTAGGSTYIFTTPADTNTHRPIQVNGTEILGNNTTALNLKAGSNVTLSNDGGTVTINSSYTNTDVNVTQTATSTNANYEVLFSATADNTTRTETARKNSNLLFNPSTGVLYGPNEMRARDLSVSANNGTSGGISLYSTSSNMDNYGIYFRQTSNKEKHGYVQGDWATYFTMNDQDNRGWVFRRNKTTGNVASIDTKGQAVFNGSVTVGGNATNTSGMRFEYDSTNECTKCVFVA